MARAMQAEIIRNRKWQIPVCRDIDKSEFDEVNHFEKWNKDSVLHFSRNQCFGRAMAFLCPVDVSVVWLSSDAIRESYCRDRLYKLLLFFIAFRLKCNVDNSWGKSTIFKSGSGILLLFSDDSLDFQGLPRQFYRALAAATNTSGRCWSAYCVWCTCNNDAGNGHMFY